MKKVFCGGLLLLLVFGGEGCWLLYGEGAPKLDAANKRVLIIPFQDRWAYYYHSADGEALADSASRRLAQLSSRTELIEAESAQSMLPPTEPTHKDWQEIGKALRADYIVMGEIVSLTTREPDVIGMLRGKLVARVAVFDSSTGSFCYQESFISRYPSPSQPYGIPVHDTSEEAIKQAVITLAADYIAGIFVGWRRTRSVPNP